MKLYISTLLLIITAACVMAVAVLSWAIPEEITVMFVNGLSFWPIVGLLFGAFILAIAWHQNTQFYQADHEKSALILSHQRTLQQLTQDLTCELERLKIAAEHGQLAYWEWDIQTHEAYFSEAWLELLGETQLEPSLTAWQKRIHPADQARVQVQLLELMSGESLRYENTHRVKHADGHYLWVLDRGSVALETEDSPKKLRCVRIEINAQKALEMELKLHQVQLQNTTQSVAIIDNNHRFIRTNSAFHNAFGFDEEDTTHLNLKELLNNLQDEPPLDILFEVDQRSHWQGELTIHDVSGNIALASLVDIQKVVHENTPYYTLLHSDITDLRQAQAKLEDLINTDQMTQLPNRSAFLEKIDYWIDKYTRMRSKFTVIYLDLDNFKTINDTLGHHYGDDVLKSVSDLLLGSLPEGTYMARVGGNEFVLLCRNFTDKEQLKTVGDKVNQLLKDPFTIGNQAVKVTASVGMAVFPEHGETQERLLKNADIALYQAKHTGKGQYRIYSEQDNLVEALIPQRILR